MRKDCRGFSLLEVLVAFVILGLTVGVLMRIFSGGLNNLTVADGYSRAVFLAESKLAALGVEQPLREGGESGEVDHRFRWSTEVRPYQEADQAAPQTLIKFALYQVVVRVSWDNGPRERSVQFATLRLAPRPGS